MHSFIYANFITFSKTKVNFYELTNASLLFDILPKRLTIFYSLDKSFLSINIFTSSSTYFSYTSSISSFSSFPSSNGQNPKSNCFFYPLYFNKAGPTL